ncbi:MAG: 4Fe-4S dicluster domain-containing protein, partial [Alphaproteobacteria bacterium]|nr:4Fe-4S dicluster domain-containing protein [Alphaproteobacteria bacterium]
FYFGDAPTLMVDLVTGQAPIVAYTTIGVLTATTYLLGGLAREQVCTYMCPWPRIQGAMLDDESLMVSYRGWRGEPRSHYRKGESWDNRGDCIDCKQCVVVCPMGIDIRDGAQLECINCALCIDACNDVMTKINRPGNLIAYDSFQGLSAAAKGENHRFRPLRPRTLIYAGLIAVVGLIMLTALLMRTELDVNVLRDRNPLFVRLSDGGVRNGYTLRILNKEHDSMHVVLTLDGLEGGQLVLQGHDSGTVEVPVDDLQSLRAFVVLSPEATRKAMAAGEDVLDFAIVAHDTQSDRTSRNSTTFRLPEGR